MDQEWEGDGFRMIQVHFIYCALYFKLNAAANLPYRSMAWGWGTPDLKYETNMKVVFY